MRAWNEAVSPSDPIAVASLLAGVALRETPDLVLTGVQSSDFANGATAAALGGVLGWPHAAVVVGLGWDGQGRLDIVPFPRTGGRHPSPPEPAWPAVLSIQTGANVPRYATMRMIKEAKSKSVADVAANSVDRSALGRHVAGMDRPPLGQATMIEGSAGEVAARVAAIIREKRGI